MYIYSMLDKVAVDAVLVHRVLTSKIIILQKFIQ